MPEHNEDHPLPGQAALNRYVEEMYEKYTAHLNRLPGEKPTTSLAQRARQKVAVLPRPQIQKDEDNS